MLPADIENMILEYFDEWDLFVLSNPDEAVWIRNHPLSTNSLKRMMEQSEEFIEIIVAEYINLDPNWIIRERMITPELSIGDIYHSYFDGELDFIYTRRNFVLLLQDTPEIWNIIDGLGIFDRMQIVYYINN